MSESCLEGLISQYHRLVAQGKSTDAAELCRSCPELLPELVRQIDVLSRMERLASPTAGSGLKTLPPALPGGRPHLSLPGYEVLEELGRGAMGVIYRARHTMLGREVAIKMILSGDHAGAEEVARLRAEAAAVARLRHPGIVQIYEVAEHEGRPYLSLELCSSGSLERRLGGKPLPPAEAAELVRKLAEAVHAAHRAGVVHRDLKPANVLLAEDGSPKVTDFGLAKVLDQDARTRTGSVMGTPSYMAPEQALAYKSVGPPADIYALGAILYECLTGRPPFLAATLAETFALLLNEEPLAPRQLSPGIPADLETVCLKCLHKDRARRYPTAQELADDLGRWLRGEPVLARPVGKVEQAWKWVRRNPTVSALAATVVLVLVAGVVVSSLFATEAWRQAKVAQDQTEKAGEARDAAEATLIDGLLRPIAHHRGDEPDLLERETLKRLVSLPSDKLRARFLARCLSDPEAARRVGRRDRWVATALVGLHPERREAARSELRRQARHGGLPAEVAAFLLVELNDLAPRLDAGASTALVSAIRRAERDQDLRKVLDRIGPMLRWLDGRVAVGAADALLAAVRKTEDEDTLQALSDALAALGEGLAPPEASGVGSLLLAELLRSRPRPQLSPLAAGLAAVCGRLRPVEADQFADRLVVLARETDADRHRAVGLAITATWSRFRVVAVPRSAATADALQVALEKAEDAEAISALCDGIAAVCGRLEEPKAAAHSAKVAGRLLAAMSQVTSSQGLRPLCETLERACERLDPASAGKAIDALLVATANVREGLVSRGARGRLIATCAALCGRLDAASAKRAAGLLKEALVKAPVRSQVQALGAGLAATCRQLAPADAGPVADSLVAALTACADADQAEALAQAVAAAWSRLDEGVSARSEKAARALLAVLDRPSGGQATLKGACDGLAAVCRGLSPGAADETSERLITEARRARTADDLLNLQAGLVGVCGRVSREAAGRIADSLLKALSDTPGLDREVPSAEERAAASARLTVLSHALTAAWPRLSGAAADDRSFAAANTLLAALGKGGKRAEPSGHDNPSALCEALATVSARLDDRGRAANAAHAADLLLAAIGEGEGEAHLREVGEALSAAVGRLDPAALSGLADRLLEAISRGGDRDRLRGYGEGLKALSARLNAVAVARLAFRLLEAMSNTTGEAQLITLGEALTAAAGRLSTPALVRLLAHAEATPESRRAVLDALGRPLRRHFRNAWHFIDWAKSNGIDVLPLTTD